MLMNPQMTSTNTCPPIPYCHRIDLGSDIVFKSSQFKYKPAIIYNKPFVLEQDVHQEITYCAVTRGVFNFSDA